MLHQIKEYKKNVIPYLEYQEKKETKKGLKKESNRRVKIENQES